MAQRFVKTAALLFYPTLFEYNDFYRIIYTILIKKQRGQIWNNIKAEKENDNIV